MKEEFKAFVRRKPELIKYVNDGQMTWQKFYEQWSLYGEDDSIWNKYKEVVSEEKKESFSFSSLIDSIKNIDVKEVQKGIDGISKAVEILQGFVGTKEVSQASYKPRQLFKKFED